MKNKDKYDLTRLQVRPKYMVNGCGRKITGRFTFDILYDNEVIERDVKAKDSIFPYLMKWLEKE